MGKTILHYAYDDTILFTVRGIAADAPANSHLQFDALFSLQYFYPARLANNWGGNWLHTFLELAPQYRRAATLEKKFPAYLKEHMSATAKAGNITSSSSCR